MDERYIDLQLVGELKEKAMKMANPVLRDMITMSRGQYYDNLFDAMAFAIAAAITHAKKEGSDG